MAPLGTVRRMGPASERACVASRQSPLGSGIVDTSAPESSMPLRPAQTVAKLGGRGSRRITADI